MNWKELNKKAVITLIQGRVKKVLESKRFGSQYAIENDNGKIHHVDIITKKGHNEITCDCENCLTSNTKSNICYCKIVCIMYAQRNEVFK